jgi:hypothetical protein
MTAVLLSQSRKREPLQRTTRRDQHLAIPPRKREQRLPFLLLIRQSAIGTQQPIAFQFDRFGRLAPSKRRTPEGQDSPSLDHSQPFN